MIGTIIGIIVVILVVSFTTFAVYFFWTTSNQKSTEKDRIREKKILRWVAGIFFALGIVIHPFMILAHAINKQIDIEYKCKHCNFIDSKDSVFCPNCRKNTNGQLPEYRCKFCDYTTDVDSKYCPICRKDGKGKYENGIF